jgi:hypothetical protein
MNRGTLLASCLALGLLGLRPAQAEEPTLIACESLVALRLLTAAPPATRAAERPGCTRIARDRIGMVEQRAMVGGTPYECLSLEGSGRCLWVVP